MFYLENDITAGERKLLSCIKRRPGMFLGEKSLRNFEHFSHGYTLAMRYANMSVEHNILPSGIDSYTAIKYTGGNETPLNCFSLILQRESNDEKVFDLFFKLLDEYLISVGYNPIPVWNDATDLNKDFFTGKSLI